MTQHVIDHLALPDRLRFPIGSKIAAILAVVIGIGAFLYNLQSGHDGIAWSAYLIGLFYFLSLALFGLVWPAIQALTGGVWTVPMRRIVEAMGSWLSVSLVLGLILLAGLHSLYHWSHTEVVAADELLLHKAPFLNATMFTVLVTAATLLWLAFSFFITGASRRQDKTGDPSLSIRTKKLGAVFLLLYAPSFSMVSFYYLMSLDAHWFSTMYAVVTFTDMMQSGAALVSLTVAIFMLTGRLTPFLNENHLHDIAKIMYAFTGFWAYIYFCQFLLIWYGNLPEETLYFIARWSNGWLPYLALLPIVKFVIPFIYLTPRENKRRPKRVITMAVLILLAQFLELYVMVSPAIGHGEHAAQGHLPISEFLVFLGFAGAFYLVFTWVLGRHHPVPIKDPLLGQSMHHHT